MFRGIRVWTWQAFSVWNKNHDAWIVYFAWGNYLHTHQPRNPTAKFVQVVGNITYRPGKHYWTMALSRTSCRTSSDRCFVHPLKILVTWCFTHPLDFGLLTWCLFWMVNGTKALKKGLQIGLLPAPCLVLIQTAPNKQNQSLKLTKR